MDNIDTMTGIPNCLTYAAGRVIFIAQKIEQCLKRIIFIEHEMGKSETFAEDISKIEKLTFENIIKEVKKYDRYLSKEGVELLINLKGKRNYVSHEIFKELGVDKIRNEEVEQKVFRELDGIVQKFAKAEVLIWNLWKGHENEYEIFKIRNGGVNV